MRAMNSIVSKLRMDDEEEKPEKAAEAQQDQSGAALMKHLMDSRTILLFGEISQKSAEKTIAQLIALAQASDEPIKLLLNSPGGHVESGDSIHDAIRFIKPKVKIIGTGWVASAGVTIYLGADKEDRLTLPNTRFMIHQPLGGLGGRASEIEIEAREILKIRARINKLISDETGQPLERVTRDTDKNFWMTAEEAKEYGLVTRIVKSIDEV